MHTYYLTLCSGMVAADVRRRILAQKHIRLVTSAATAWMNRQSDEQEDK
jgi:hypothetical protein